MKILKSACFGFALTLTLIVLVCIATPHMYAIILWDKLQCGDGRTRRDRIYRWYLWWAEAEWLIFTKLMRITTHFDLPTHESVPHPSVVISNHRSSVDVVLVPILLRRMGFRKLTAVVKDEVKKFPVVGRAALEIRSAFVARSNDPDDLERVRECAENAKDDGTCILIFPEGTIREHGQSDGRFSHLLVPKTRGLSIIRGVVPHWPILSITLDWGDISGASSIYTAWTMFGGSLTLRARYLEDYITNRPLEDWLNEEWDRKEQELANSSLRVNHSVSITAS